MSSSTATTYAAREHARAQAGTVVDTMPVVPAGTWPTPPDGVQHADLVWAETVAGGNYTSKVVAAGTSLQLTDVDGDAAAHVVLLNADQPWERLNVADTTKVAWQAYLGPGHPLLSDQGRVLAVVTADTSGHHDALCGTSSLGRNREKHGDGSPHGPSPAGRELLTLAGLKHGLSPRDLPAGVTFLKGASVADDGALTFTGGAGAGASVTIKAELPLVVLIANVPHPLDPRTEYVSTPLRVLAWKGEPTVLDDPLATGTPEARRAYLNTVDYAVARGLR